MHMSFFYGRIQVFGRLLLSFVAAILSLISVTSFLWGGYLVGHFYGGRYGLFAGLGFLLVEGFLAFIVGFLRHFPLMERRVKVFNKKHGRCLKKCSKPQLFFWSFCKNFQFFFLQLSYCALAAIFVIVVTSPGWIGYTVAHFSNSDYGAITGLGVIIIAGIWGVIDEVREDNPVMKKLQDEAIVRLYS